MRAAAHDAPDLGMVTTEGHDNAMVLDMAMGGHVLGDARGRDGKDGVRITGAEDLAGARVAGRAALSNAKDALSSAADQP